MNFEKLSPRTVATSIEFFGFLFLTFSLMVGSFGLLITFLLCLFVLGFLYDSLVKPKYEQETGASFESVFTMIRNDFSIFINRLQLAKMNFDEARKEEELKEKSAED